MRQRNNDRSAQPNVSGGTDYGKGDITVEIERIARVKVSFAIRSEPKDTGKKSRCENSRVGQVRHGLKSR
jgi:hypothetical protein